MYIKQISIADIVPYEKNAKTHPDEQVEHIANSIREFGFKQPLVLDSNNVVIIGHGRLLAAKRLGLSEVPVLYADDLTDAQVKALRLADNKTNESEWDFSALDAELDDLRLDFDMSDFGFDLDDNFEDDALNEGKHPGILQDRFIVPPFSILDARQGYWIERKKVWKEMIGDVGQARDNVTVISYSARGGYVDVSKYNNASILDPVLSEIICKWFTPYAESKCFDVFAGDTVFGYVSSYLGHTFTGIELRKEQVDFNNQRVNENAKYICDDGRNVLDHIPENSQDLFFSCPPYFDLEIYSDAENDASNQETYEDFYAILHTAFVNGIKCLKNDRFAVMVVGDVRNKKTGGYYRFPDDVKKTFCENGMQLYNELILIDPIGTAAYRAGKYMDYRKVAKIHQNVLVFYKGDTKDIRSIFPKIEVDYESEDMEL